MFSKYIAKKNVLRTVLTAVLVAGTATGGQSALVSGDPGRLVLQPDLAKTLDRNQFAEPGLLLASEGGGGGGGGGGGEGSHFRPNDGIRRPPGQIFRPPSIFRPPREEVAPPVIIRGDDGVDERVTRNVIAFIRSGTAECAGLPPEYRADCLAQVYYQAASLLRGPGYADARRELVGAARRIERVVTRNLDRSKPPIQTGGKTARPVRRQAVSRVNREVRRIVADTEKRLIRSAGRSAKRRSHYQRIAQAVGTGKTILRS